MEEKTIHHRRKGPDRLLILINVLILISFFIVFLIIIIVLLPETSQQLLDYRKLDASYGENWKSSLLQYALYLMILQVLISVAGLIIRSARHKRRTDRYPASLITLGILSLIGVVLFIVL